MIILAFDSTAKAASVAVCKDERLLGLYNIDNGLTHSELLLPMAEELLDSLKLGINDIGLLAAAVGPGSFTGVRIGASLVKGLAFGKNIPCIEVSTLDELCENLRGVKGYIVPCMDARRSQVYTATYYSDGEKTEKLTPDRAISLSELGEELKALEGRIYLVGDGYAGAKKALGDMGVEVENTPPLLIQESAYSCAMVALRKYRQGHATSDRDFKPTYLRMPQAERERLERLNNEKDK